MIINHWCIELIHVTHYHNSMFQWLNYDLNIFYEYVFIWQGKDNNLYGMGKKDNLVDVKHV